MPGTTFGEGDPCALDLDCVNPGAERPADLYVLLDVLGEFWSYPSWQPLDAGLDHQALTIPSGSSSRSLIPEFTMPAVGPLEPLYFYAALFEPDTLSLETMVSNAAAWQFSLEE